jgi:hypothetical protein
MSFVTTQPVRVAIAVGCVLVSAAAGCSSRSPGHTTSTPASTSAVAPPAATSAAQGESIPGIGATRAAWDASHMSTAACAISGPPLRPFDRSLPRTTRRLLTKTVPGPTTCAAWDTLHESTAANNDGSVYGYDPSLPSYLTDSGAVYSYVDDQGTGRIQSYNLNMHPDYPHEVLPRVLQELPSDATVAWVLTLDQCYRMAFNSATLEAAVHYMAEVKLEYIQEDGTTATSPDTVNVASFSLTEAGSPPNPESGCG